MMILATITILLPLFLIFLIKHYLFGVSNDLPPGPNTWQIVRALSQFRNKPHVAFKNLANIHGPLISVRLGAQLMIVASSPPIARKILKTHDRIFSGRSLPSRCYQIPGILHSSLSTSKECNETWKFLRGICQNSLFSSRAVDSKGKIRRKKVMEMMDYLLEKEGEAVKLDDIVHATVCNIVTSVLASRNLFDVGGKGENEKKVKNMVSEIVEMAATPCLADLIPILKRVDFWSKRSAMDMYGKIMYVWEDIIKERRSKHGSTDAIPGRDFLDVLVENAFLDNQTSIILTELLMAGTDSTIITIIWLMVELIRNQGILNRVREEIAQTIDENATINESLLSTCEYFQACIRETLRLHIPGPFLLPHRAFEKCKVNNYIIPKDSMVLVNAWAIQSDPDYWEDATSFKPDRFLDLKNDLVGTEFDFLPFGSGRRMCPGFHMGFRNIQLVVASLIHCFDWSLPNGVEPKNLDTSDVFGTTLKREKPLYLIPKLRKRYVV